MIKNQIFGLDAVTKAGINSAVTQAVMCELCKLHLVRQVREIKKQSIGKVSL